MLISILSLSLFTLLFNHPLKEDPASTSSYPSGLLVYNDWTLRNMESKIISM